MKTALIMEGGAMRGMFTAGVMDVFLENGIRFDGASGISAGAAFGCNYKSGQAGRVIRYNKRFSKDPRFCSLRSLIKTGDIYGAEFCYYTLPEQLDLFDREAFERDPMEFYVGATNVRTGHIEYHLCRDGGRTDIEWMRASASMPVVSKPVTIDGESYLDGGMSDPVPYRIMEEKGYDRNVIVLTRPLGYVKKKSRMLPAMKLFLRRYPAVYKDMETRHEVYNRQMEEIREREQKGDSLVIRPPKPLAIGHVEKDPGELERVYQTGRNEAYERLDEVRLFLKQQ